MKFKAIIKYLVKNNINYKQNGRAGGPGRAYSRYQVNQLQFLTAVMSNSGSRNGFTEAAFFFPWVN